MLAYPKGWQERISRLRSGTEIADLVLSLQKRIGTPNANTPLQCSCTSTEKSPRQKNQTKPIQVGNGEHQRGAPETISPNPARVKFGRRPRKARRFDLRKNDNG